MEPQQVLNTGTLIVLLLSALIGALTGSGTAIAMFIVFLKIVLGSPATMNLIHGVVHSFPPEMQETLRLLGKLLEQSTDAGDTIPPVSLPGDTPPKPADIPPFPIPPDATAKSVSAGPGLVG